MMQNCVRLKNKKNEILSSDPSILVHSFALFVFALGFFQAPKRNTSEYGLSD